MCVISGSIIGTELVRQKKANGKPFRAYKILGPQGNSPYMDKTRKYGPGVSAIHQGPRSPNGYRKTMQGLHLFWAKPTEKTSWLLIRTAGSKVVPVLVDPNDIIIGDYEQLAVRRLYINPRTWKRIFKDIAAVAKREEKTRRRPWII